MEGRESDSVGRRGVVLVQIGTAVGEIGGLHFG